MRAYASFYFEQSPLNPASYILKVANGEVRNLILPEYKPIKRNIDAGISGKKYLLFTEPRSMGIRRFFPKVFEMGNGLTLSGVEELNEMHRTFGDTKKLGSNDLILVQFSEDMKNLSLYFVKNLGFVKDMKKKAFRAWNNGESLICEV